MSWQEILVPSDKISPLVSDTVTPLMARLLAIRGVDSRTLGTYLNPSLKNLDNPSDLPGIDAAASRMLSSLERGEKIAVAGDYDCDGICASAILLKTLMALSADAVSFIPDRTSEGYGLSNSSIRRLQSENPGVKLVVTVDNGINSVGEIAALKASGIDVIVTDHHLPGEELPDCLVVNPKVAAPAHLSNLCGAGVAFMLAAALVKKARETGLYDGEQIAGPLVVLAGLATVTDIMPLTGLNRILVHEALKLFPKYAPLGLQKLFCEASRSGMLFMKSRDFGFCIGPRINAPGRISSASESLNLVMASQPDEADKLARRVEACNSRRKVVEAEMLEEAERQIVPAAAAQIITLTGGDQGVAGIVAARILERTGENSPSPAVPVAVVVGSHGSARAADGYNVRDALAASSDALVRYGGHSAAAGFTVKDGAIGRFRALFAEACERQRSERNIGAERVVPLDAWVTPSDITAEFANGLSNLEPFGEGNPEPVFAFHGISFADVKAAGQQGRHLQISFTGALKGFWWNKGALADELAKNRCRRHDVAFKVSQYNQYSGGVDLRIIDIRPCV